jgi:hypothetical protein
MLVALCLVVGGSPVPARAAEARQLHMVVLLDLSDRIDPTRVESRHQADIDRQILGKVVTAFVEEVRRKRYVFSRDSLQVHVAPQPIEYRGDLVAMADGLRIDVKTLPLRDRRSEVHRLQAEMVKQVDRLYSMATRERHLVGADLWSFFRNNLEDLLPCSTADENRRNVLVVLTDGYLDFDEPVQRSRPRQGSRTSYMQVARYRGNDLGLLLTPAHGLIPARSDALRCIEVLVLEMRERRVGDRDVLQAYWSKWLDEMGVARFELKMGVDSPSAVGDVVDRFMARPAPLAKG